MMKKLALIALVLMMIGAAIAFIGFAIGISPLSLDADGMHVREQLADKSEFLESYDSSTTVSVSVISENFEIVRSDRFGYTISGDEQDTFDCQLDHDRLIIKQRPIRSRVAFSWDWGWRLSKITIYIPSDMSIDNLTLDIASGDIRIDSIDAGSVSINGTSGNLTATQLTIARDLDMRLASGDVRIDSVTAHSAFLTATSGNFTATNLQIADGLKTDMASGDVKIAGVLQGNLVFNTMSGNLRIEIDGKASDYRRTIEGLSGSIRVNDDSGSLANNYPDGSNSININALSGDISIRFLR